MSRMMPRAVLVAIVCCFTVAPGMAQPPDRRDAPTTNAAAATNDTAPGDVHLDSSRVYIRVGKTGLGHEHAVVGKLQNGAVHLDSTQEAGVLVFDMQTFTADGDAARRYVGLRGSTDAGTQQQVNANMLGRAVLDVARFPTAEFTIASATQLPQKSRRGFEQYELAGDFTLHGVKRPIKIIADAEPKEGWVHLRGAFSILQSQFGIQPFTKAFGAIGVADKLTIYGDLWVAGPGQTAGRSDSPRSPAVN